MRQILNSLLSLFFLFFLFVGNIFAATYYVDTDSIGGTANDSNSGIITEPWLTIAKANTTLTAGDTVYIRLGTYSSEQINPSNSGTSGNEITYENYNDELVTISGGSNQCVLTSRSYIIIDGISFYNAGTSWIYCENTDYCTIQNCTFELAGAYSGLRFHRSGTCDYNKILDNTFKDAPNEPPSDHITANKAVKCIFSGNSFGNVSHNNLSIFGSQEDNVVRNNTFQNKFHMGLELEYNRSLIENNTFLDCGENFLDDPTPNSKRRDNPALQHRAGDSIIRYNKFDQCGNGINILPMPGTSCADDNRVYNNTVNSCLINDYSSPNAGDTLGGNIFKNNIFTNPFSYGSEQGYNLCFYRGDGTNRWKNNCGHGGVSYYRYDFGDYYNTFAALIADKPTQFPSGNIEQNPVFTNEPARDFTLQSTSPCIDAGTWLTEVNDTGGGSGTSMVVDDALYFYDGWGIPGEVGDYIWVDNPSSADFLVQISSINYGTHTLTLASSQTWDDNADVYLAYSSTVGIMGAGVDIGAEEYDLVISDASPGQGDTGISITINLSWTNPTGENTNDGYFKVGACPCDAGDSVWTNQAHQTTYDPGTLAYNTAHCWRVDIDHDGGTEAGTNYGFTTTSQASPPTPPGSGIVWHKSGGAIVYHDKGLGIQ